MYFLIIIKFIICMTFSIFQVSAAILVKYKDHTFGNPSRAYIYNIYFEWLVFFIII